MPSGRAIFVPAYVIIFLAFIIHFYATTTMKTMTNINPPTILPMKKPTHINRRLFVLRSLLGGALFSNYFFSANVSIFLRHNDPSSSSGGSYLEGTAAPPTTTTTMRVRRAGKERSTAPVDANIAIRIKEDARRDLLDCGIVVDDDTETTTGTGTGGGTSSSADDCDLVDDRYGTPTILMSLGRSGSSVTWQLMSGMTGNHTFRATEDTGSSTERSHRLFDDFLESGIDGKCWIQEFLCRHQEDNRARVRDGLPYAGLYGFKWKPYASTFGSIRSVEALDWLSRNPHVKVVHNVRNPLDVIISRYKHRDRSVAAHCGVGDDACSESHRNAKPTLSTKEGRLIHLIDDIVDETDGADRLLDSHRVPHVDVSYERLYLVDDIAVEWRRLFSFLGVGPTDERLTSADLISRMEHQATSDRSIRDKIRNYDEVEEILRGTEYEIFLSDGA
jgi:hypothetical protein